MRRRISFHIATKEQYFTMCGSTLFHIRRQPNISLIYIYLYFNEIQLRRVKYSFAVKYLLRKCEGRILFYSMRYNAYPKNNCECSKFFSQSIFLSVFKLFPYLSDKIAHSKTLIQLFGDFFTTANLPNRQAIYSFQACDVI